MTATRLHSHIVSCSSAGRSGFALIVIAALFTAVAVIGSVAIENRTVTNDLTHQKAQQNQLAKVATALNQYALRYGRLPCPAQASIPPAEVDSVLQGYYGNEVNSGMGSSIGACTTQDFKAASSNGNTDSYAGIELLTGANNEMIRGMVPFKLLAAYGITENDAYDAQNDRIMYVVNRNLTTSVAGNNKANNYLLVTDGSTGSTMNADFVVVSYGRDKLGGIARGAAARCDATMDALVKSKSCTIAPTAACTATNSSRDKNCDVDINFVKMPRNTTTTGDMYFDDDIIGGRVTCSNGTLNRGSDGACTNTYCWGDNSVGQLGNGTTTDSATPIAVTMPSGVAAFQAIDVNSDAATSNACAIAASFDAAGNALSFGDVYCWGQWSGNTTKSVPTLITGSDLPANFKATNVKVGSSSICMVGGTVSGTILTPDGNIYCWGQNTKGQLGNNSAVSTTYITAPVIATKPAGVTFTAPIGGNGLSGDGTHWCAIGSDSNLYCWGDNSTNQLGTGGGPGFYTTPQLASLVTASPVGVGVFSVGGEGSTAYKADGSFVGWGAAWGGSNGALVTIYTPGYLQTNSQLSFAESTRDGNSDHQCISISTAANANIVYCKGNNGSGQLGNNNTSYQNNFVPVSSMNGTDDLNLKSVSVGGNTTCALGDDGLAYCWGKNDKGQLGTGSVSAGANSTLAEVKMPASVNSFIKIVAGGNTTCALAPTK